MTARRSQNSTRRVKSLKARSLAPKKARNVRGGSVEGGHATFPVGPPNFPVGPPSIPQPPPDRKI